MTLATMMTITTMMTISTMMTILNMMTISAMMTISNKMTIVFVRKLEVVHKEAGMDREAIFSQDGRGTPSPPLPAGRVPSRAGHPSLQGSWRLSDLYNLQLACVRKLEVM